MTLGAFLMLMEQEAQGNDSGRSWSPQARKLALKWTLSELAVRAVREARPDMTASEALAAVEMVRQS